MSSFLEKKKTQEMTGVPGRAFAALEQAQKGPLRLLRRGKKDVLVLDDWVN